MSGESGGGGELTVVVDLGDDEALVDTRDEQIEELVAANRGFVAALGRRRSRLATEVLTAAAWALTLVLAAVDGGASAAAIAAIAAGCAGAFGTVKIITRDDRRLDREDGDL